MVTALPNSTSERSPPLEKSLEQFPFINLLLLDLESEAQALATDWTRCSSSAFLQPHQLTSGWPQREITAPLLWCLETGNSKLTVRIKSTEGTKNSAVCSRSFTPTKNHRSAIIPKLGFSFPSEWWLWPQSLTGESQSKVRKRKQSIFLLNIVACWPVKAGECFGTAGEAWERNSIWMGKTDNTLTWTWLSSPGRWHLKTILFYMSGESVVISLDLTWLFVLHIKNRSGIIKTYWTIANTLWKRFEDSPL